MKYKILLLIGCLMLLLSGCASAQITYTLNERNEAAAIYALKVEKRDVQTEGYLNTIGQHWESLGFGTVLEERDDQLTLTGEISSQSATRRLAAERFFELAGGDNTALQSASFEYVPGYEQDEYHISATVTLEDVIRQSEAQNIPEDELNALLIGAQNGQYALSLALPGEVTQTNADETADGVHTWRLEYGQSREILLHTVLVNQANIDAYAALEKEKAQKNFWLWVSIIAAAVLLLVLLTFLFTRRILRIRASKVRVKKFR